MGLEQGWVVYGWQPLGENTPVIWAPYVTVESYWGSTGDDEAWSRILEQAMCGEPTAIKAMKDIVSSNPEYFEYQATLDALTAINH